MAARAAVTRTAGLVVLVVATGSCGSVAQQSSSPVYLVINSLEAAAGNHPTQLGAILLSSTTTQVTQPPPCSTTSPCNVVYDDVGSVTLADPLKDIGTTPGSPAVPTSNNQVTIKRIHINYRRADGLNTPGVDVPYPWDAAVTGTIPPGGTLTLGFEIVRNEAKFEAPLVQLNGTTNIITTLTDVTFYGADLVGNQVTVTGTIQIDFGYFPLN